MTDFFTAISNFGFPIVVAGYLLFRFEKKIDTLTDINISLKDSLSKQTDKLTSAVQRNTAATNELIKAVKTVHINFQKR